MIRIKPFLPYLFLTIVACIFFYPFFLHGRIPFPGDLLTGEYKPWRTYSYLGYVPGSIPNKAQYFDVIRQLYPWRTFVIDQIKHGQLPLWNPYNFSGSPLLANHQSAVFYPLQIFYFIFSQPFAWTLILLLQSLLSSWFTFAYGKKIGLSTLAALFAAITFSYSIFFTVFLEYNSLLHVILWVPLWFLAIEHLIERKTIFWSSVYILTIICSAFAGHLQLWFYVLLFGHLYLFIRTYKLPNKKQIFIHCGIISCIGLGITSVQMLPTMELIRNSARANQPYNFLINTLLIQPKQLAMLIIPDIFGNPATRNYLMNDSYPGKAMYFGLIPLVFTFLAMWKRKQSPYIQFFLGVSIVVFIFLIHTPMTELFYRFPLPFIASSSPSNALWLIAFSGAILSGFGLDIFRRHQNAFLIKIIVAITISFLSIYCIGKFYPSSLNNKSICYSGIIFVLMCILFLISHAIPKKKIFLLFIILLSAADAFYLFNKFNPFVPQALIFPKTNITSWLQGNAQLTRYWSLGSATIEANFSTQMGGYSPEGYDPLYPNWYGAFISGSKDGHFPKQFTNATRSDARIAPFEGSAEWLTNQNRQRILELSSVGYILDRAENSLSEKDFPPEQYTQAYSENDWHILTDNKALPRTYLVHEYKLYNSDQEAEQILFSKEFDPHRSVILGNKPTLTIDQPTQKDEASIRSYTPNEVQIQTKSDANGILVLTDTFYPGWIATIDGLDTLIFRANYTFRGIQIPAGNHIIKFIYAPKSIVYGGTITLVSLITMLLYFVFMKRNYAKS